VIGFDEGPAETICSRAGCRALAGWNVNWRNPRIHGADRVKVWPACDEHVDYLRDYLKARDFPVVVSTVSELVEAVPDR
jgi:hypothetical protein